MQRRARGRRQGPVPGRDHRRRQTRELYGGWRRRPQQLRGQGSARDARQAVEGCRGFAARERSDGCRHSDVPRYAPPGHRGGGRHEQGSSQRGEPATRAPRLAQADRPGGGCGRGEGTRG